MTLSHTVSAFCNLSIPPLTPFLRDALNLTHAEAGFLMSFIYIGVVSSSLFFGWITDLLGERRVLPLGLGIQGLLMIGFAWPHGGDRPEGSGGFGHRIFLNHHLFGGNPVSASFRTRGRSFGLLLPGVGYAGGFLDRGFIHPVLLCPGEEIIGNYFFLLH